MIHRIWPVLALVLLFVFPGCSGQSDPLKTELLYFHNRERAKTGQSALVHDDFLESSAQKWADWMAQHSKLVHSKLPISDTSFQIMGENIAMGYPDTDSVLRGWMASPGHRKNILNPKFSHAGFGYARSPDGASYWCVQFGGP